VFEVRGCGKGLHRGGAVVGRTQGPAGLPAEKKCHMWGIRAPNILETGKGCDEKQGSTLQPSPNGVGPTPLGEDGASKKPVEKKRERKKKKRLLSETNFHSVDTDPKE